MNRIIKQKIAFAVYMGVILFIGSISAVEAFAGEDYKVSIGSSAWSLKKAYSSDLSRAAIENGKSGFVVSTSADKSFKINLSKKQMADILAGSTVVVDTEDGNQKVKIEPQMKKAAPSGW
jgi:ABC-type phosphate transport system substrate-binding protein